MIEWEISIPVLTKRRQPGIGIMYKYEWKDVWTIKVKASSEEEAISQAIEKWNSLQQKEGQKCKMLPDARGSDTYYIYAFYDEFGVVRAVSKKQVCKYVPQCNKEHHPTERFIREITIVALDDVHSIPDERCFPCPDCGKEITPDEFDRGRCDECECTFEEDKTLKPLLKRTKH